ncbi:hypothetical protein LTS17_001904 [Exophiala oligosperma]
MDDPKEDAVLEQEDVDQVRLFALTQEELVIERKLRRKIDLIILPMVVVVYIMNYIDRRLQGLEKDLNLTGDQYQVGLSVFFVSYVLAQIPSNLLLNYSGRPSWVLGLFTIGWGLVSALTSQVKGYAGIVAARFFLGALEAPFFPGVLFYLSKWYTRREISLRMAIFYAGSTISGAFGSLIASAILDALNGSHGMSAWQWLYIIEGAITISLGILLIVVLPDFPETWRLLTPEAKAVAVRRLTLDAADADVDEKGFQHQIRGMKLALSDPKVYLFAIMYHVSTAAGGFQNFFPSLTATLGYSHTVSLLLVAPPYILVTLLSFVHGWVSDRVGNRYWFYMYPIPLMASGAVIFMTTHNFGARYAGLFLMTLIWLKTATSYAWISSSVPRPPAKRSVAMAFVNAFGNAASIWTPYTYYSSQGGNYPVAMGVIIGCALSAGVCATILRFMLVRENKEFARLGEETTQLTATQRKRLEKTAQDAGVDTETARAMQKDFRYML